MLEDKIKVHSQQLDKKLAPPMESVEFINAKYDDLQKIFSLISVLQPLWYSNKLFVCP